MDHLTITEVPTIQASEIQVGRELRNGATVKRLDRAFGNTRLFLSDNTDVLYPDSYPVPVADRTPTGQSFTIDITPEGCKTPEGAKRVAEAQKEWDDVTHELANVLKEFIDLGVTLYMSGRPDYDAISQIQSLIGARDRKQEAFLRAVAGK